MGPLQGEAGLMFQEGVRLCIARWTALQLAISENDASPRVAQDFQSDIVGFMIHAKDVCDLEEFLESKLLTMEMEYIPDIQDGSIEEVAQEIMCLYEECRQGKYERVKLLYERHHGSSSATAQSQQIQKNEDEEDEEDEEWLPHRGATQPELRAEEGWHLVRHKRK